MKKIICLILTLCLIIPQTIAFALDDNIDSYIDFVSNFDIINGDPDGNFRLDDFVTRAEFTKIATASSSFRNSVATNISVSPFNDVPFTHWAAPYVKLALTNGIVNGYEDASFRPDSLVLYEEGITMFLKLLGYTNADFGSSWPQSQVGIARNIGLSDNVDRKIGDALTREDCVKLTYNLLNTKKKNSTTKYIAEFDSTIIEDAVLLATSNEDTSVGAGKIATTSGTYEIGFDFNSDLIGKKGDIVVKDGDEIISFIPNTQIIEEYTVTAKMGSDILLNDTILDISEGTKTYYQSKTQTYQSVNSSAKVGDIFKVYKNENGIVDYTVLIPKNITTGFDVMNMTKYIVYSVLDDKVLVYDNGIIEQVDFNNLITVYEDENKMTSYSAIKQNMEMGDILNVKYDSNNDIEYVVYEEGNLKGPITVTPYSWYSNYGINTNTVKVMRDGKKADFSSLNTNDIVYYSNEMDMILGYSKKVVGVYENASPNKDTLTNVTISGITYSIESAAAFSKLSSTGQFNFGDTITVLLGKNGEIADVVSSDENTSSVSGILTQTGNKTFKDSNGDDYTSYYAKIVGTDGVEGEYKVGKDYEDYKNSVVVLTYSNGVGKLNVMRLDSSVSGVVSYEDMKIGNDDIASDIEILEVYSTNLGDLVNYKRTYPQRLDGITLSSSNVIYANYNNKGEISNLVLKDVTGDMHTYAITTDVKTENNFASYTFNSPSGTMMSNGYKISNVTNSTPVKILIDKTKPSVVEGVFPLVEVDEKIIELTKTSIKTNSDKDYLLSTGVAVYKKSSSSFLANIELTSLTEIINGDYNILAYYDKLESKGGRIRVIVATPKN